VNYYERYIGDYQRDTAELSLAEHGAYTMLLDTYYATEKPLPPSIEALCRICRAFGAVEQKAVKFVTDKFFPVEEDGFRHNKKADGFIREYQEYVERCKVNGKKGGRPKNISAHKNNQGGFENANLNNQGGYLQLSKNALKNNQEVTTTTTTLKSKAFPAAQPAKAPDHDGCFSGARDAA
jgi:uncharacterized protein YdaU (DUF1376 family)